MGLLCVCEDGWVCLWEGSLFGLFVPGEWGGGEEAGAQVHKSATALVILLPPFS